MLTDPCWHFTLAIRPGATGVRLSRFGAKRVSAATDCFVRGHHAGERADQRPVRCVQLVVGAVQPRYDRLSRRLNYLATQRHAAAERAAARGSEFG